jgi:hypothetical protein
MAIQIELASGSDSERRLQLRLSKILARYGPRLERWQFTDRVVLDEGSISHSHPILTIGARTKAVRTNAGLLAVYLHEQIHWFLGKHPSRLRRALRDLRARYLQVKVGAKEGGARDEKSTHLHLLVCTLEYDALRSIIGNVSSKRLLSSKPYYPWIYKTVARDFEGIRHLCVLHELIPSTSQDVRNKRHKAFR